MVTTLHAEPVPDSPQAVLGEGPIWDAAASCLYWIDIQGRKLFTADAEGRTHTALDLPRMPGTVMPAVGGGLILADEKGLELHGSDGSKHVLDTSLKDLPNIRFNDGKVDRAGRAVVGTLTLDGTPGQASLRRLEHDGTWTVLLEGISLSNGLGWSPDDRTFYHVDTPTGCVDAFIHDPVTGKLTGRRQFARTPSGSLPDGLCVDHDGGVWVALYGGSAVVRYDPHGRLDTRVEIPVPHVTSCTFGGHDSDVLFVTTAQVDLDEEALSAHPHAGGLFRVETGRSGPAATHLTADLL